MSRVLIIATVFTAALLVLVAGLAFAQSQNDWQTAQNPEGEGLLLGQSYHGTVPGGGNTLPRVEELKGKPGTWVTWPGFVMRADGGSRIFIQTTRSLEYTKTDKKNKLYLKFKDAKVHLTNNRNPLVTIHFNTPVRRAYLKRAHKSVELAVEYKVSTQAAITQFADNDGYHYLFIDFPVGQYPVGGDFGDRPSFKGIGAPHSETTPIIDDEIPPQQ